VIQDGDELHRLRTAIAAAGDAAYDWDLASERIAWWGAAGAMIGPDGLPPAYGDAFRALVHAADIAKRDKALADHLAGNGAFDCEYRLAALEGPTQWIHERGAVIGEGGSRRLCGTLRNITQRKRAESQLEYLARYDELTGHFNRSRLKEALDHALSYAQRYHTPGAYMVVGIDRLAAVNEAFGHAAADAVIVGVGQRLDRCLRASDVIGRSTATASASCWHPARGRHAIRGRAHPARGVAERDRHAQRPHPRHRLGRRRALPRPVASAHDAMTRADSALQQAKGGGRNCFVPFDDSPETREERRRALSIGEEVQAALKHGRLITRCSRSSRPARARSTTTNACCACAARTAR